jgi:hypothetical protein
MEFASKGVAGAGLGLGIAGTALGVLNGGLGNILGNLGGGCCNNGWNRNGCGDGDAAMAAAIATMAASTPRTPGCYCSEDHNVNRYEAAQAARIAELETEVKLRDSNIYTDQKILEVYKYFDGENKEIREELCKQRVHNQRTEDSFVLARQDIAAVKAELEGKIRMEAEKRCCADNAIVNYANNTFYPKMVAAVTTGTETTAQTLYNPIPDCGCCGNG